MVTPVSFTCVFSNPRYIDGSAPGTPVNYGWNWQFNSETCTYNGAIYAPSTTTATSSDIQMYASFTAGEVLMTLLMFILIMIELMKMLFRALDRIKTKKTFFSYTNADVEVKEEL